MDKHFLTIDHEKCETVATILRTLSNPQRLLILCSLIEGEKSVSDLQEVCTISQPVISQHLSRMKLQSFVKARKEGNFVYYSICDPRIVQIMQTLYELFCAPEEGN